MVFFGKKIESTKGSILSFFNEREPDELLRLASELSPDAKAFFELSLSSLLGQLPPQLADVEITTSREGLYQLLLSGMVTGYLTKAVEDKISLENLYNYSPEQMDTMIDQLIKPKTNEF